MATYYKYVERNEKDRIDWSAVGKSVSDMLKEEAKVRLDKKAEIDERSRQIGIELSNAPTGDYDHGNNFINEYVTNMTEYRRMQDNLLKSGQLNLGDYTRNRQNNTDGTKLTFDMAKSFQEAYTEKMERWQTDKSAWLEVFNMNHVEGMANLRNTGTFINPANGVVSLANRDANGNINMNQQTTVAEMLTKIKTNYDRYDADANVKEKVDYLGDYVIEELSQAMRAGGLSSVKEIDDKTAAPGFTTWKENTIDAMMTNKFHVADMLTTGKLQTANGEFFDYTYNEDEYKNDKTGTLIFLDRTQDANGIPVLTDKQDQTVRDFLSNQIDEQIDYKVSVQSAGTKPYAPQPTTPRSGLTKPQKQNILTNMAKLVYGNEQEIFEAIDFLEAFNPGLDIVRKPDGLIFTQGGVVREPKLNDIQSIESFLTSQGQFLLPADNQIDNIEELVAAGGFIPQGVGVNYGLRGNVVGSGKALPEDEPVSETVDRELRKMINIPTSKLQKEDGTMKEEGEVARVLNQNIKNIEGLSKYVAKTDNNIFTQGVILTSSVEGEADIKLPLNGLSAESLIDALIGAAKGNLTNDDKAMLIQGKQQKVGGGSAADYN